MEGKEKGKTNTSTEKFEMRLRKWSIMPIFTPVTASTFGLSFPAAQLEEGDTVTQFIVSKR